MCLLGSLFRRHGSSCPDGALMLAARLLRSVSVIFRETSVDVPTFSRDVLTDSSPGDRQGVSGPSKLHSRKNLMMHWSTGDLGCERTAGDVFVIKLDDDVVVSRGGGQVGYGARPVFVVFAADLCFGRALHGQRETACKQSRT